jgi:ABC-2 type transport system ATP-binding protein
MVTGITMPDSGDIIFNNEPFVLSKHSELIGYMPEERGLYKKMKINEQAMYLAQLKGLSKSEAHAKINYWFKRLNMQNWENKKVEDLSKGMSQKLQFVLTVVHDPKLLILDEPFSGLDPLNSEIIKNEIFELAKNGSTIIFSTHRMEQVEEICEEIILINKGKSILQGDVKSIKEQFKLNHYKLEINNDLIGYDQHIVSKNGNEYILHFNNQHEVNAVLNYCIQQQIKITSFQEILPSLNEIFISQVEGSAARQFSNN